MKKFLLLLPGLLLPYGLLLALVCVFTGAGMETLFGNNALALLLWLAVLAAAALVCNLAFLVLAVKKQWDAKQVALANLLVKLAQIPAYAVAFCLGVVFLITIFTFGFSIFFVLFDCLTIFLTGLTGAAAAVRCSAEGKMSASAAVGCGLLSFVFCIDVGIAVVLLLRARSSAQRPAGGASGVSPHAAPGPD